MAKKKPAAAPEAPAAPAPEAPAAPVVPVSDRARPVFYCLPERFDGDRRWRPALIVNDLFADGSIANLSVFLDGANDLRDGKAILGGPVYGLILSVSSAKQGDGPGNWKVA